MPLILEIPVKGLLSPYKEPTDGAGRRGLIQKGFVCRRSPWKPHQKVSPVSVPRGSKNPGRLQKVEHADVPRSERETARNQKENPQMCSLIIYVSDEVHSSKVTAHILNEFYRGSQSAAAWCGNKGKVNKTEKCDV